MDANNGLHKGSDLIFRPGVARVYESLSSAAFFFSFFSFNKRTLNLKAVEILIVKCSEIPDSETRSLRA